MTKKSARSVLAGPTAERMLVDGMDATWNRRQLEVLDRTVAADGRLVGAREAPRLTHDKEAWKRFVQEMISAFPDICLEVLDSLGDEAKAFVRGRMSGTHLGTYLGIPATGRRMVTGLACRCVLKNGRAWRSSNSWDLVGILGDLGDLALPPGPGVSDLRARLDGKPLSAREAAGLRSGLAPDRIPDLLGPKLWNQRRGAVLEAAFHPDAQVHWVRERREGAYGLAAWRTFVEAMLGAFPDLELRVRDAVSDPARCFWYWQAEATHLGTFLGHGATGRPVKFDGHAIAYLKAGRIAELYWPWDLAGLLVQLGGLGIPIGGAVTDLRGGAEVPE